MLARCMAWEMGHSLQLNMTFAGSKVLLCFSGSEAILIGKLRLPTASASFLACDQHQCCKRQTVHHANVPNQDDNHFPVRESGVKVSQNSVGVDDTVQARVR